MSGYVDDSSDTKYLVDEDVTSNLDADTFFEVLADYSYFAERHAAVTNKSEASYGDNMMLELAFRIAPMVKMINGDL